MTIRPTGREEIEVVLSLEEAERAFEQGSIRSVPIWALRSAITQEKELVDGLDDVDYAGAV